MVDHQAQISSFRDLCYEMCLKINTLLGIGLEVSRIPFVPACAPVLPGGVSDALGYYIR